MSVIPWGPVGAPMDFGRDVAFQSFAVDSTTDAINYGFQVEEALTITKVKIRVVSRTGTPPTYRVSLQSWSNGVPTGTVLGGGSPASATFTPPADSSWDNTIQTITLDNAYVASRGEFLFIVIDYSSGTIDASNRSTFTTVVGTTQPGLQIPCAFTVNSGTRSGVDGVPVCGYASSTTVYGRPVLDILTVGSNLYSSGSTPDEKGALFNIPTTFGSAFQVVGCRVGLNANAAGTCDLKLYGPTDTLLQSIPLDTDDFNRAASMGSRQIKLLFDEAPLATLSFGTNYRLTLLATSASVNLGLHTYVVETASDWDAFPWGQYFQLTQRTDAGAWTDTPTRRPQMELILRDLTGGSGGGLLRHPGMVGGLAA